MKKFIVGIGASAGGLDPLKSLIGSIHINNENVSFIIAQHLSPDHKSILANIISQETKLEVNEAQDNELIKDSKVYITPPGYHIVIENYKIRLKPQNIKKSPTPSVDLLFKSIADNYKERAFGVILSGTGSDGSKGLIEIKEKGGYCIVQAPETAKYDGMPNEAIRSGHSDYTAPVNEIWNIIREVINNGVPPEEVSVYSSDEAKIFKILHEFKKTDFEQYKPNTLLRRIDKRMLQLGIRSKKEYLKKLEDEKEIDELFHTLLIGFTYFFRDPNQFKSLKKHLTDLIDKKEDSKIRIWVPGCATGEEAYTIAIILQELLGKKLLDYHVQIFATDIDQNSLDHARRGVYDKIALEHTDKKIIKKYFFKSGSTYEVDKTIRSMILFSRHDVTSDPHFLKLDMISCRNLLIYLKKEVQDQLIPLFHHSLNEEGLLILGESENVRGRSSLFEKIDSKSKTYQKKESSQPIKYFINKYKSKDISLKKKAIPKISLDESIGYSLIKYSNETVIVVNEIGEVIHVQGETNKIFKIPQGQLKTDIFSLANDRINIELRRMLDAAKKENTKVESLPKNIILDDVKYKFDCKVFPLEKFYSTEELYVFTIGLSDAENISLDKLPSDSVNVDLENNQAAAERIAELENELIITKEYLQNYVEELETANEELQSMNEEMQSTNEELQSSNEELETSNEELQSTSEEMHTAYNELRQINTKLEIKEKDLNTTKENMSSLLNNSLQAFFLFNIKGNLLEYNSESEKMVKSWEAKEIQEGAHFSSFIPDSCLKSINQSFKEAIKGNNVADSFWVVTEQGTYFYEYSFSAILDSDGRVNSISLGVLDFTDHKKLKNEIESKQKLINSIFRSVNIGVLILNGDGIITRVNNKVSEIFGYEESALVGQPFTQIIPAQSRGRAFEIYKRFIEDENIWPSTWKMATKEGYIIDVDTKSSIISDQEGSDLVIITLQDVTDTLKYKTLLEEAGHTAMLGGWEYDIDNDLLEWTDETYEIYDMDPSQPVDIEDAISCYSDESQEILREKIDKSIKSGTPYDLILNFESKSGLSKWVRTTCKPIMNNGYTIKLLGTIQDVSESKLVEDELKKLSLVATKALNSIIITDGRGYIEWVNRAFSKVTGYSFQDAKGKRPGTLLQGKDTDPLMSYEIGSALDNGKPFHGTILNYTKTGEAYWNELYISPVKDEKGEVKQFISVQSDVTEQIKLQENLKASLKEKESLLKEVHHRVKNNLALVNAMLYLQESESEDPTFNKLILDTQRRIKSIASVHEIIYQTESFSDIRVDTYLNNIIKEIEVNFTKVSNNVKIQSNLSETKIEVEQAIPFALICNEVITNALKHAYPNGNGGIIKVVMKENNGDISFKVSDNGKGLPENFDPTISKSLGVTLIDQFTQQLEGKYTFKNNRKGGATFYLKFENRNVSRSFN